MKGASNALPEHPLAGLQIQREICSVSRRQGLSKEVLIWSHTNTYLLLLPLWKLIYLMTRSFHSSKEPKAVLSFLSSQQPCKVPRPNQPLASILCQDGRRTQQHPASAGQRCPTGPGLNLGAESRFRLGLLPLPLPGAVDRPLLPHLARSVPQHALVHLDRLHGERHIGLQAGLRGGVFPRSGEAQRDRRGRRPGFALETEMGCHSCIQAVGATD